MKKILLGLLLFSNFSYGKIQDSIQHRSMYARIMPFSLSTVPVYSSTGTSWSSNIDTSLKVVPILNRIGQSVEIGYSMGILDVGVAIGRYQKNVFIESRFTIDGFQVGNFSNEYTIGFGYISGNQPLMLEATSTIMLQATNLVGVGLVTGYLDFAGNTEDVSRTYFGVYVRIGFLRLSDGTIKKHKTF